MEFFGVVEIVIGHANLLLWLRLSSQIWAKPGKSAVVEVQEKKGSSFGWRAADKTGV